MTKKKSKKIQSKSSLLSRSKFNPVAAAVFIIPVAIAGYLTLGADAFSSKTGQDKFRQDGRIPNVADVEDNGEEIQTFDSKTKLYTLKSKKGAHPPVKLHPDPASPPTANSPNGAWTSLPSNTLAPTCAASGNRIVPVYAYTSTINSSNVDRVKSTISRMNYKLNKESHSSAKKIMKVDCSASVINVRTVRIHGINGNNDLNDYENIRKSVEGHGAIGSTPAQIGVLGTYGQLTPTGTNAVKYMIFTDSPNPTCCAGLGWGWFGASSDPYYSTKSTDNYNRNYTTSAIVWQPYWETHVTLHELMHAMGASQNPVSAPNTFASNGAHCVDGNDILCYNDNTTTSSGLVYSDQYCTNAVNTPDLVPIDCNKNTYFNTYPYDGFLSQYWNTGGVENPFIGSATPRTPVCRPWDPACPPLLAE